MSSIILRNTPHAAEGDTERIAFGIIVDDADWVGLFDRIQIFRSVDGASGPFEELTSANWDTPRLPKDAGDIPDSPVTGPNVNIVGNELLLTVFEQPLSITFTGSDPLTHTQVAAQIVAQSLGRLTSYVDVDGRVVIDAVYPGLASRITILESDGATALGLPTLDTATGKDPRIQLVAGTTSYAFVDPFGSRDYHYRTRFINSSTGETSDYSISFSSSDSVGVGVSNTIIGYVELIELSGKATENAEVHVFNEFDGTQVDGKLITGGAVVKLTDESGQAEFVLTRGQRLTVSVQGTTLIRTITVPSDPALSRFNLFDAAIGAVDVFRVSVPEIITAERRTL